MMEEDQADLSEVVTVQWETHISLKKRGAECKLREFWGWLIHFTDPETGERFEVNVDVVAMLELADLAKRAGVEIAFRVFLVGARIAMSMEDDVLDVWRLQHVFNDTLQYVEQRQQEVRATVLAVTYDMLTEDGLTRREAAEWASRMLGRPISPDGWRRAVDNWAAAEGLPKIDLPTGRPRKKKSAKVR